MGTKTYRANRSSLLAQTGSTELGGGADTHLPAGAGYGGYTFASVVDFPAIAWGDVKTILSARVDFTVTNGVHADPRAGTFAVRRVTAQWSPNGNSSSADSPAGGGWGTSGAIYGSISGTNLGEVIRTNPPSGSGSVAGWDITDIVKAWAPASVAGGGGQPQYGLYIYGTAGGMEYYSARNGTTSTRPLLVIEYSTDPPNTPTWIQPTGKLTTQKPTYEFTATDPQGLPIQSWDIEERPAGGSSEGITNGSSGIASGKVLYTSTVNVARGPREVRSRVYTSGLWSAWSAWHAYAIDRLPTVSGFSAPAANVSTVRPAITFAVADADADPIELYDLEVYAAPGGTPTGTAVYKRTGQTAGISAASVTHTPAADLPPGELAVRSRARTFGTWSAWSSYHPFTVVVAVPSVTWLRPDTDGGFIPPSIAGEINSIDKPAVTLFNARYVIDADVRPPAGFTLTKVHRKITRLDGPAAPVVVADSDMTLIPAGGIYSQSRSLTIDGFTSPWGTLELELVATASNAGVTTVKRRARVAMGEWFGAVALGDSPDRLAAVLTPLVDYGVMFYRAQSSPTAAAGAAPWRTLAELATVEAELPATNAFLGLWGRDWRLASADADILNGEGGFENGYGSMWISSTLASFPSEPTAPDDGTTVLQVVGDGVTNGPGVRSNWIPLVQGVTYRLGGWCRRTVAGATGTGRLKIDTRDAGGAQTNARVMLTWLNDATSGPWTYQSATYTVPTDGTVVDCRVMMFINGTVTAGMAWQWDGVTMTAPALGAGGLDKLALSWESLG